MKKLLAITLIVLIVLSLFSACSSSTETSQTTESSNTITSLDVSNMFTDRDFETSYNENSCIKINLSGDSASCSDSSVKIENSTVTLSSKGDYIISGTLNNGQIIVDTDKNTKIRLILKGANISSNTSSPIYVKQADKVFITLDSNTENTLSTKGEYVNIDENNIDGVIFAKDDISLNGSGTLNINNSYGHGIVCKNDLVLTGGTYNITTAKHALTADDSVRIADGSYNLTTEKDGIHAENTEDTAKGYIYVKDGTFNITATTDGIDSSSEILIENGSFNITSGSGSGNSSVKSDGSLNADWGNWGGSAKATKPDSTGQNGGDIPSMPSGDMAQGGGSMPSMPSGDMAQGGGDIPSMPSGDMAQGGGSMPSMPSGDMAQGGGDIPSMPSGDMAQGGNNSSATDEDTASAKGIKATGNLTISSGVFNLNTSDDSLHSNADLTINNGDISISSGDDGTHAYGSMKVNGGNIKINKSYEGIEGKNIEIAGGNIDINSSDDGFNASGGNDTGILQRPGQGTFNVDGDVYINITGGKININASGDGIDNNGNIYISGGETYVSGSTGGGDAAFDYGDGAYAEITGGILVATGNSSMAEQFSDTSTQGAILYNMSQNQDANTTFTLKDSSGKELVSYTPPKKYNSILVSTPDIQVGQSYTITAGTQSETITMSSITYGGNTGMGSGGGMMEQGKGGKTRQSAQASQAV